MKRRTLDSPITQILTQSQNNFLFPKSRNFVSRVPRPHHQISKIADKRPVHRTLTSEINIVTHRG